MIVRPAEPADIGSMAALDALAGPHPWTEERLRRAFVDVAGIQAFVLEPAAAATGGALAGFILIACQLDEGTVLNIAVHPDSQGSGLGLELLQAAMRHMRNAGMARCLLEVRRSNSAARAMYQRAGFAEDGVRKNYYRTADGREDAVLLSRPV